MQTNSLQIASSSSLSVCVGREMIMSVETLLLLRSELDYCVLFSLAAQMTKSTTVMVIFFIHIKSFYGEFFFFIVTHDF